MADPIESPEAFAVNWCMHPTCSGGDKPDHCCAALTTAIRARDAAVRREARSAMLAVLTRQCQNSVTAAVSEEWLRYHEGALLSGALAGGSDG